MGARHGLLLKQPARPATLFLVLARLHNLLRQHVDRPDVAVPPLGEEPVDALLGVPYRGALYDAPRAHGDDDPGVDHDVSRGPDLLHPLVAAGDPVALLLLPPC